MKKLFIISLCLLVAACGYTQLYTDNKSATADIAALNQIRIMPIDERLGVVMYNRLQDIFGTATQENYQLNIQLIEEIEGFGFRSDAAVTQEEVRVIANVRLVRLVDDELVYAEALTERTSFDVALSDFANETQRDDAKERLVRELAEQLHRRLAIYFRNQE